LTLGSACRPSFRVSVSPINRTLNKSGFDLGTFCQAADWDAERKGAEQGKIGSCRVERGAWFLNATGAPESFFE